MRWDLTIGIGELITFGFGSLGLFGIWFAYKQIKLTQIAHSTSATSTRSEFALHVSQWFFDDRETMNFFYRLDYDEDDMSFRFNKDDFSHTDDEYELDRLLYKLSHVGCLIQAGVLETEDINVLRSIIRISLENESVGQYLTWIQSKNQVPDHSDFLDAILLYQRIFPGRIEDREHLLIYREKAIDIQSKSTST